MAFLNLRNNHLIYILRKDTKLILETGKVLNISLPVPKYGGNSMFNDLVLDMTVDINGTPTNFQKIPANREIADFGNNVILACTKDAMNSELASVKLRSLDIINSIDQHRSIVNDCDQILLELNPEIAEKLRQELENKALREELNSLKEMFKEFINETKKHGNNN